jgi:hypothetical protein
MNQQIQRIEQIQVLLKELLFLDEFYKHHEEVNDYAHPVLQAAKACEFILIELLYENGIEVKQGFVKIVNRFAQEEELPVLSYCSRLDVKCIPTKIRNLLQVIRTFRNRAAHFSPITLAEMLEFNRAFDAFKCWFFYEYDIIERCDEKTRIWFNDYLITMENDVWLQLDDTNIEKARIAQLKNIRRYIDAYNQRFSSALKLVENEPKEFAFAMEEYKKVMLEVVDERTTKILDSIADSTKVLSAKIDHMSEILERLETQINAYQTLVQNQIDLAVSEDEIERIVHAYTNTCVDKIVSEIDSKYSSNLYENEKEKLMISLGEKAWNKLSAESQNFLVSAKVSYHYLLNIKNAIDYSGVCLLVTKAVEVEMKKRFYTDYVAYLKTTYPGKSNYSKFPKALLNKFGQPIKAKEFTLGKVTFALCAKFSNDMNATQKNHDRQRLVEYAKTNLLAGKSDQDIIDMLESFGEEIGDLTDEFRNKAAHTNELKRVNAQLCFDLVLDVEKLLKRMLDAFAY